VTATWSTPAPASVASGQAFPVALTVTGTFQSVSGNVVACRSDVPVNQCGGSQLQVTSASGDNFGNFFAGPPGTFPFSAQGIDCQGPEDFYFVARLFLQFPDGTSLGPFFSPLTTTTLQAPTGPLLQVSPTQLPVNTFEGLTPPPQALSLQSVCGESVAFSAAADVPWLSLSPPTGTVGGSFTGGPQQVTVTVDVTGLSAAQSPLRGTVTVTAPTAANSPLAVPVTLKILGP